MRSSTLVVLFLSPFFFFIFGLRFVTRTNRTAVIHKADASFPPREMITSTYPRLRHVKQIRSRLIPTIKRSPLPLLLFSSCATDLSNRMKRRGLNKLGNRVENAGGTLGSQNIRKYLSMLYAGGEPNICVPRLSM